MSGYAANFDAQEVLKRMLKYLIEGLAVAAAAFWIPRRSLNV